MILPDKLSCFMFSNLMHCQFIQWLRKFVQNLDIYTFKTADVLLVQLTRGLGENQI